ncbi:MAG: hypothetical protein ACI36Y_06310 [Coriobacteriales bacterium]
MRKRILSILVSISMALLLVPAVPFAMANEDAAGDAPSEVVDNTPSITAFASKDQLMTEFSRLTTTNAGKLLFGKNDQGKPQEWFVLGSDPFLSGDNAIIFATSPILRNQPYRLRASDGTIGAIEYSDEWGCNYYEEEPGETVAPNHYGASDLRKALQTIAQSTDYFTAAEQVMLNDNDSKSTDWGVSSSDKPRNYTTTDKLYSKIPPCSW